MPISFPPAFARRLWSAARTPAPPRPRAGAPAENPYRAIFAARPRALPASPLDLSALLPRHERRKNSLLVIAGRCGSTWLGRRLDAMGGFGLSREWFNTQALNGFLDKRDAQGLEDYFEKISKESSPFSLQINPARLFFLSELLDLAATFRDAAVIDLRRRDFVAQAFSFARAHDLDQWHGVDAADREVSDDDVFAMIRYIIAWEQRIDQWYERSALSPLRIVYEDILADSTLTLQRIANALRHDDQRADLVDPDERSRRSGLDRKILGFYARHGSAIERIHAERGAIAFRDDGRPA